MGRGRSKAGRGRPKVGSLDGITDGKHDSNVAWIKNVMPGLSDEEAEKTENAAYFYSRMGYSQMHKGTGFQDRAQLLDALIDNPKTPVYNKDSYRGLHIATEDEGLITAAIASGRWKEPGISSFTARPSVASGFASAEYGGNDEISVIITNKGHTKGMPFKHISDHPKEDEVIQSSKTMRAGMKITKAEVTVNSKGRKIYNIEVDDSK